MGDFQDPDGGSGDPAGGPTESDDGHPAGWIPAGDATAPGEPVAERSAAPDEDGLDALVRAAFDLLPTQVAVLDGSGGDEPERHVATDLYHVHLPKLEAAGLLSFDPGSREVTDWRLEEAGVTTR